MAGSTASETMKVVRSTSRYGCRLLQVARNASATGMSGGPQTIPRARAMRAVILDSIRFGAPPGNEQLGLGVRLRRATGWSAWVGRLAYPVDHDRAGAARAARIGRRRALARGDRVGLRSGHGLRVGARRRPAGPAGRPRRTGFALLRHRRAARRRCARAVGVTRTFADPPAGAGAARTLSHTPGPSPG